LAVDTDNEAMNCKIERVKRDDTYVHLRNIHSCSGKTNACTV